MADNDQNFQNTNQVGSTSVANLESSGGISIPAPDFQLTASPVVQRQTDETPPNPNSWTGTVTASSLNVRTGIGANTTKIRSISRNDQITVYETRDGWHRIAPNISASGESEWVSADYIRRTEATTDTNVPPGQLPQTDLTGNSNGRAHNRWITRANLSGYSETFNEEIDTHIATMFGEGVTREQVLRNIETAQNEGRIDEAEEMQRKLFIANQQAVISVLDVENNGLYTPGTSTYCNIYAYDFVTAMGAYLPRVWWTGSAIRRIQAGESVTPVYGTTIHEMNANALNAWMPEYGISYGWRQETDMGQAQNEANSGKIVVILAANKVASRSGHIAVLLSETEQEQQQETDMPLISQAGRNNHERSRASSAWWENNSHKDGAAWIYEGGINSPIMTPEQVGGHELNREGEAVLADLEAGSPLNATNYIQAVTALEAMAAGDGYSNIQMLSAFRKLYYNSGNWNTVIEGAENTGLPPSWSTPEAENLVNLVSGTQVAVINGQSVDVGHLLTGLDAGNHETAFGLEKFGIEIFSFRSNKEFATFVGDLGSVVERYVDEEKNWIGHVSRDDAAIASHYNNLAGDIDMAGNADAYSMEYDSNLAFSQNLINYYSGETRQDTQRYSRFAESIGLGRLEGGRFTGDTDAWRSGLQTEIYSFAMAYQMREGAWEGITGWGGTHYYSNVSEWVLDYFVNDMAQKVQSESNN